MVLPLLIAAWIDEQLSVVVIHQMLAELQMLTERLSLACVPRAYPEGRTCAGPQKRPEILTERRGV